MFEVTEPYTTRILGMMQDNDLTLGEALMEDCASYISYDKHFDLYDFVVQVDSWLEANKVDENLRSYFLGVITGELEDLRLVKH